MTLELHGTSIFELITCKVYSDSFLLMEVYFMIIEQELTDLLNAPVVFAHNDLLSGNLMLNDDEGVNEN